MKLLREVLTTLDCFDPSGRDAGELERAGKPKPLGGRQFISTRCDIEPDEGERLTGKPCVDRESPCSATTHIGGQRGRLPDPEGEPVTVMVFGQRIDEQLANRRAVHPTIGDSEVEILGRPGTVPEPELQGSAALQDPLCPDPPQR